ncbi:SusC/RagA family TonB-linked outer membrane protein [Pseudobacter ginsenosidimutans]|nr:SusC/RagA family TonB-linked outer membrane protein [Pseudobacter ginsenosidimutans]
MTNSASGFCASQSWFSDRSDWRRTPAKTLLAMRSTIMRSHRAVSGTTVLAMKLTFVLLTLALFSANANMMAQKVSIKGKDLQLKQVFTFIEQQTGYVVFGNKELFADRKKITLSVANMPLTELLALIFKDQPFDYSVEDKTILISKKKTVATDLRRLLLLTDVPISGRVVDASGNPVQGASIRLKPGNKGTTSNADGSFIIEQVGKGEYTVEISLVGHLTISRKIKVNGNEQLLLSGLVLIANPETMNEVTVSNAGTGYQTVPKERATGSFSRVDNKTFNRQVSTDVITRLKGIAPSIMVDERGAKPRLAIRGQATIWGNDQPLIVVDNFPYEGDLSNINPNDVEDISILKDAAAASIWGIRAGNGVIVIKTKRGSYNKPMNISFNLNTTVGEKPDLFYISKMGPSDFIDIEKMLFEKGFYNNIITSASYRPYSPVVEILNDQKNNKISATEAEAMIDALRGYDLRKDMEKYLYQQTIRQQYALSLNGGGPRYSYYFSAGFDKNREAQVGNDFSRISLNSNQVFKPVEKLEFTVNLSYNRSNRSSAGVVQMLNNMGQEMMYPYARLVDDNGEPAAVTKTFSSVLKQKALSDGLLNWDFVPLKELELQNNKNLLTETRLNAAVKYSLLPQLSAEARFQYENQWSKTRNLYDQDSYTMRDQINSYTTFGNGVLKRNIPLGARLDNSINELNALNGRLQLNYDQRWKKHQVHAIAGIEVRQVRTTGNSSRLYGFDPVVGSSAAVDYVSSFKLYGNGYNSKIPNYDDHSGTLDRLRSYYINGAYDFDLRYVLSASARIDQSNVFGVRTNQKSVPLWSAGARWNISKESFYTLHWLPELSLRTTYGYSGNVDKTLTAFTTARLTTNYSMSIPAADLQNPPNKDLRWEKNAMWNMGIDFGLAGNRLSGSIEYFSRKGTDLIGNGDIDPTSGYISYRGNLANMTGRGIDIELNSVNIQAGDFNWKTTAIFSYAKDKVTKYQRITSIYSFISVNDNTIIRNPVGYSPVAGRSLFGIYSYPWAGLDPATGQPRGTWMANLLWNIARSYSSWDKTRLIILCTTAMPSLLILAHCVIRLDIKGWSFLSILPIDLVIISGVIPSCTHHCIPVIMAMEIIMIAGKKRETS